jgi:penicillin-binding protein 2
VADDLEQMPRWRLVCIGLLMLAGFLALGFRLHRIQVRQSPVYAGEQRRQSIRRVLLPAPRGRIFDRNGVCLADNRPEYCIAVYLEELRRPGRWNRTIDAVDQEVDRMAAYLGVSRQITRDDIEQHVYKRLPLPLLAWQGIDERTLARFSENLAHTLGFDIYVQPNRVYPQGALAAHLLGYVGRDRPVMTNEVFHYDIMGMRGRAGIERAFDTKLSGTPGGQLITVTVTGYKHSTTNRAAIAGVDVRLTLDVPLQQELERLLRGYRAAGVILDPRNGDVLAMASQPAFNPNEMSPSISHVAWGRLRENRAYPLLNRAISGVYPPGSIFKPMVALTALGRGVSPDATITCTGVYPIGNIRCWLRAGHGALAMRKALEQSCNPFFCAMGVHVGLESICDMSRQLGLGAKTGIEIAGELPGLLPSDAWKRRVHHDAWRTGDTANLSIGQGALLVTPLQMAVYAAALANGGRVLRPRLVINPAQPDGECRRRVELPAEAIETVRQGLRDVVHAVHGTGKRARVKGLTLAGKTGTAEYGSRANLRKHTWMIAFAPYDEPRVAMVILVENGESGGMTAAPIVRQLLRFFFHLEPTSDAPDLPQAAEDTA